MDADRLFAGRYAIGDLVGRGGMAEVYRGRDIRLSRPVAIKLPREDLVMDPWALSRFRREAQTVAGLGHPNIVSVYDTGEVEAGSSTGGVRVPYLVMEYVAGPTLRALLVGERPTLERSIRYQVGVLAALACSHRAGVVHRDIKPSNVMITPDGSVKVVDFGIARSLADSAVTMTRTGTVLGTARYLAPEQARGGTVDARSDLYSAGCLLYELLTGRPPFVGDSAVSVAYQHVYAEPARISTYRSDLAPALDPVLVRALAKDRDDRFQTAREFSDALLSAAKGLTLGAGGAHEAHPRSCVPVRH